MTKPYCIGSNDWPGLSKLIEECGEVLQTAGKIIGNEGSDVHFSGLNLRSDMHNELGDLFAAMNFFIDQNHLNLTMIQNRRDEKLALFQKWHGEQS